jgi:hypothetical protein
MMTGFDTAAARHGGAKRKWSSGPLLFLADGTPVAHSWFRSCRARYRKAAVASSANIEEFSVSVGKDLDRVPGVVATCVVDDNLESFTRTCQMVASRPELGLQNAFGPVLDVIVRENMYHELGLNSAAYVVFKWRSRPVIVLRRWTHASCPGTMFVMDLHDVHGLHRLSPCDRIMARLPSAATLLAIGGFRGAAN